MTTRSRLLLNALLLTAVVGWGCQVVTPTAESLGVRRAKPKGAVPATVLTQVSGFLRIPARLIGPDAGTLIGPDAGTLIGPDAGTLIGPDAGTVSLAGARVFLADAAGRALPGVAEARTDALGRFTLMGVPAGLTYVVVIELPTRSGEVARLTSLASTHAGAAEVRVGLGSTLVTAALVDAERGLGRVDNAALQAVAEKVEKEALKAEKLPDLTKPQAVAEVAEAVVVKAAPPEVKQEVEKLEKAIATAPVATADLAKVVQAEVKAAEEEAVERGGTPVPTVAPSVATPVQATPAPTARPSEAPSAMPLPQGSTTPLVVASALPTRGPAPTPAPGLGVSTVDLGGEVDALGGVWGLAFLDADLLGFASYKRAGLIKGDSVGPFDNFQEPAPSVDLRGVAAYKGVLYVAGKDQGDASTGLVIKVNVSEGGAPVVFGKFPGAPTGVAVDGVGNVYVADEINNQIMVFPPDGQDGRALVRSLKEPTGLAYNPKANELYVADTGNHCIRQIKLDGSNAVSLLAGREGVEGTQDGTLATATFARPMGLAYDDGGNRLYVADSGSHLIRVVDFNVKGGAVSRFAGVPNTSGEKPGDRLSAIFTSPAGLSVRPGGDLLELYVAEPDASRIRRIVAKREVATLTSGTISGGKVSTMPVDTAVEAPISDLSAEQVLKTGGL
ncbi:MAG: hypothetical protein VKS61_13780 [Candidatus Sericytochromatia bacterium]|nr:hypothetical protein [Candidatus Sericytochromatia bacterium]